MAKGVLIQPSFYEAMKGLPDTERLSLYDSICEYSLNGKPPDNLSPMASSLFILMKPNIDSSNKRYRASVENGKKGGAPKGNKNAKKQPKNNQTNNQKNKQKNNHDYDYDLDSDYDSECDSECECDSATPPAPRGQYKNVFLTEEEYKALQRDVQDIDKIIDKLSVHIKSTGRTYASHEATVRKWAMEDAEKKQTETRPNGDWCSGITPEDYKNDIQFPW